MVLLLVVLIIIILNCMYTHCNISNAPISKQRGQRLYQGRPGPRGPPHPVTTGLSRGRGVEQNTQFFKYGGAAHPPRTRLKLYSQ